MEKSLYNIRKLQKIRNFFFIFVNRVRQEVVQTIVQHSV